MKFLLDLENFLRQNHANYPQESVLTAEPCPAGQKGDFTVNCFKIGRFCGNPMAAAGAVVDFLGKHGIINLPNITHKEELSHGK